MRLTRDTGASLTTLLSLVVLYLVLIVLVLVFAAEVLEDLSFTQTSSGVAIIILAVVFPLLLLGFTIVNLLRLFRERALGRPGARLKVRLVFFFAVIVCLASIPQGALSVNFIRTAVSAWFAEDTGEAIQGGQRIALAFFSEREAELQSFARSRFLDSLLAGVETQPDRVWDRVTATNPAIDSMQVFRLAGPQFEEWFYDGPEELRLSPLQAAASRDQQVARESVTGVSFLRVRVEYVTGAPAAPAGGAVAMPGTTLAVIFGVTLPPGFDSAASNLTTALESFVQLERFQGSFVIAIGLFYAFFSVPLILLGILVSFFLSDEIIRPIVRLEEATRSVAEGDFSTRILARSGDELASLVESFNRMVSELERTRTKIIQTEKIAAWQEIAQRLAHEIRNPLTPIRLAAERALRKREAGSADFDTVFRSSIHSIIEEVDNLSALLTEFREFSRLPPPLLLHLHLLPVVQEVATMYGQQGGVISVDIDPGAVVQGDAGQLKQVFANLFKNAMEAMPSGSRISVTSYTVRKGAASYCRIQVEDNGPGIPEAFRDQVFAPYVTTKKHGTGLGLAIVERIVFDHHGQIWFESQESVGTTFFIDLPVAEAPRPAGDAREPK